MSPKLVHAQALAVLACFLLATGAAGAGNPISDASVHDRLALDVQSFDHVWRTVRDRHWDPQLGGLDWDAVRAELRPRVAGSATRAEARAAMVEMLARLGASHYAVIPAEAYEALGRPDGQGVLDGDTGITPCVVAGHALVRSLRAGSPAAAVGVRTGWEVLEVDGEDIEALLHGLATDLEGSPSREGYMLLAASDRLAGPVGQTLSVRFADGDGGEVVLGLTLVPRPGHRVELGHLPPQWVHIDVDVLSGGVGCIAFNAFLDPIHLMPAFNQAMAEHLEAPGLIIDLRGNGGGMGWLAMGMAGWLVSDPLHLGVMTTRETELRLMLSPRLRTYSGPLAILVDGLSASGSEMFTGGLQDIGRARVFGSRTAGAVLPSIIEQLPNGDGFQCAFAHYVSHGGAVLEGRGVIPDVEVSASQEALLAGRDPVLEAALDWIRAGAS